METSQLRLDIEILGRQVCRQAGRIWKGRRDRSSRVYDNFYHSWVMQNSNSYVSWDNSRTGLTPKYFSIKRQTELYKFTQCMVKESWSIVFQLFFHLKLFVAASKLQSDEWELSASCTLPCKRRPWQVVIGFIRIQRTISLNGRATYS
jgi:hypothetical protein